MAAAITVVQSVSPGEEAEVQRACRRATTTAAVAVAFIIKVLQLHKPLRPELPTHPLAEHGKVDQLT